MSDDNAQMLKRGRLMTELVATDSWKELESILNAQRLTRMNIILSPPTDNLKAGLSPADAQLNDLFLKGVIFGLQLAVSTPHGMIHQAKGLAEELDPVAAAKEEFSE